MSASDRKLPLGLEIVKPGSRRTVFCSKADIRLNLLKNSALDPKRTFRMTLWSGFSSPMIDRLPSSLATLPAMDGKQGADANRNFIPGLQLNEIVWEAFLTTGLSNDANYDKVLALSKMYAIQDIYKQTGAQLEAASMTVSACATVQETEVDNNHFKMQFVVYFEMLSGTEAQLLLSYESAIADFDTNEQSP